MRQVKQFFQIVIFILFLSATSSFSAPPIPARIGGTVTVDGVQFRKGRTVCYIFKVTKQDGESYKPAAEDTDGLSCYDWYLIDIPIFDANNQPSEANSGDTAVIHIFKDGLELVVTSPASGQLIIGTSGSVTQIDIVAGTSR